VVWSEKCHLASFCPSSIRYLSSSLRTVLETGLRTRVVRRGRPSVSHKDNYATLRERRVRSNGLRWSLGRCAMPQRS
jgi:hypothetical protein